MIEPSSGMPKRWAKVVVPMMGNGIANVIAAAILAWAIVYTGGFGGKRLSQEEIADIYARAVGDISNDIVINCGCCGDVGPRKAEGPF